MFGLSDPPFRSRQILLLPQPLYIAISLWPPPPHTQSFSWFYWWVSSTGLFHLEHVGCCSSLLSLLSPLLQCPSSFTLILLTLPYVSELSLKHFLHFWVPLFHHPQDTSLATLVFSVPDSPSFPGYLLFSSLWPSALSSIQISPRKPTVDWIHDVCQVLCKGCAWIFPVHLFPQNNPMVVHIAIPFPGEDAEGRGLRDLPQALSQWKQEFQPSLHAQLTLPNTHLKSTSIDQKSAVCKVLE